MKHVHYDSTTLKILGYYTSEVHDTIPEPNFIISDNAWAEALAKRFNKVNLKGTLEFFDFRTPEEVIEQTRGLIDSRIQDHLDAKAQEYRYDNMMSARSYAGYPNAFQEEAQSLAQWASACWVKAGEIESEVATGRRTFPSLEEVGGLLPLYVAQ